MAIDTIKSTAVLDGAIATADIADDAVTSAKIDSDSTGMALADLTVDTTTLKVDSSNNLVGIGTSSPLSLTGNAAPGLTVSSNGPFVLLQDANNADKVRYISNNTGEFQFGIVDDDGTSNKDEHMRVTASGNVGIGTIPSTSWRTSFNTTALQLGQSGSLFNLDVSNSDRRCMLSSNAILNASGDFQHIREGAVSVYSQQSGTHRWYTAPSAGSSATAAATQNARIISEGAFQASHNGSYRTWGGNIVGHQMVSNLNNNVCFTADAEDSSFQSDVQRILCNRGESSGYDFLVCTSGNLGDDEFKLRGDGQAYADGSWNGGGADYAEYFETTTGNAIPRGTTVVLDNNKVRAATSDDPVSSIIGVIRPKDDGQISAMVGNSGWSKWGEKYLTDDFGVYLMDDHNVISFDGKSYESHKVPEDVTIPDDAVTTTHDGNGLKFQHRRENPDYDPSLTYSPREDRDEWVVVGLLGQVRILSGQTMGDRWIKMRDISETVEEWFIR